MKSKIKLSLGKIEVRGVTVENINIEVELEHSIGEIKGVIDITKKLPQDLLELYKNFNAADKEAMDEESEHEAYRASKNLKYASEGVNNNIFKTVANAIKGNFSESIANDLGNDSTIEKQ